MAFRDTENVCRICQASCTFRRTKSDLPTSSSRGDFIAVSPCEKVSGKSGDFGCINRSTEEPRSEELENGKIMNRKTETVELRDWRTEIYR